MYTTSPFSRSLNAIATLATIFSVAISAADVAGQETVQQKLGYALLGSLGDAIIHKGVDILGDKAFGTEEQRIHELDARLAVYEDLVRQLDLKQANEVQQLRAEISKKTSADEVKKIVEPRLKAVTSKMAELESKLASTNNKVGVLEQTSVNLNDRLRILENIFGEIRHIPAAPLLANSVSGEAPRPHPLVVEWVRVLCSSENSRIKVFQLRHRHPETSTNVQTALMEDAKVVKASLDFRKKVLANLSERLAEREALLKEFLPGTSEVLIIDEKVAAVAWLATATTPLDKGPDKGRIGVPNALFGPQGSDIILCLNGCGADWDSEVIPLYRQQIISRAANRNLFKIDNYGFSAYGIKPISLLASIHARDTCVQSVNTLSREAQALRQSIEKQLTENAESHPEVISLRKKQVALLSEAKFMHAEAGRKLDDSIKLFLKECATRRPSSKDMAEYLNSVLLDLAVVFSITDCTDWQSEPAKQVTLKQLYKLSD